jgi:hypothetical protein
MDFNYLHHLFHQAARFAHSDQNIDDKTIVASMRAVANEIEQIMHPELDRVWHCN